MDVVLLEPLQFAVYVGFAAAEPVERLYDKRIAGAQHSRLERLIAGAVEIFARFLIRDDFSIIRTERAKGLELTIEILLACGNAGVVECFVHHITSKKSPERSYAFRTFPFIADGPFRTVFCCGFALSEKVDLVGYLVVVDKVGEQADNSQRTENDFAWVQTFTSFQLSEKFPTASIIKSTTAPTAWKIGPNGIISNISFP